MDLDAFQAKLISVFQTQLCNADSLTNSDLLKFDPNVALFLNSFRTIKQAFPFENLPRVLTPFFSPYNI
jgi:hypothetical protein